MKLTIICCTLLLTIAFACKEGKKDKPVDKQEQTTNNADTLIIDKDAAVYYQPDSIAMEKWKKEVGEQDFETVVDDWSNYLMTSHQYLDSMKVPVFLSEDKKVLKFVKADGSATVVRLDTIHNFWGVYLFTPSKEPKYADPIMIEDEHKNYFK